MKLPELIGEYAVEAGLPVSEAKTFVLTYLTVPTDAAKLPGVTADVLSAALTGSQWAYAHSLSYVW